MYINLPRARRERDGIHVSFMSEKVVIINVAVPLHHTHPYCGGGRVCVSVILPHDRCDATSAAFRLVQQGVCVIQQHSTVVWV
jgi:hypothetical protein